MLPSLYIGYRVVNFSKTLLTIMLFKHQCRLSSYLPYGSRICYSSPFINTESKSLIKLRAELQNLSPVTSDCSFLLIKDAFSI